MGSSLPPCAPFNQCLGQLLVPVPRRHRDGASAGGQGDNRPPSPRQPGMAPLPAQETLTSPSVVFMSSTVGS